MNIGQAAKASGVSQRMIRHYEKIGLIPTPPRRDSGYRDYSEAHIGRLQFLHRSRNLGFSVEECRQLLSLYDDKQRASAEVKAIAEAKLSDIDRKLRELSSLRESLTHLVAHCHGDDRPDCPIIDELSGQADCGKIRA